jgi:hypothetical protein
MAIYIDLLSHEVMGGARRGTRAASDILMAETGNALCHTYETIFFKLASDRH